MRKAAPRVLSLLAVLCLAAGVPVGADVETEPDAADSAAMSGELVVYADDGERLAAMRRVAQKAGRTLLVDDRTGDIALTDGESVWFSTPTDAARDTLASDAMKTRLQSWLRQKKGIRLEAPELSRTQIKEQEYDRLADLLRRSVDMEAIYMILEKGIDA